MRKKRNRFTQINNIILTQEFQSGFKAGLLAIIFLLCNSEHSYSKGQDSLVNFYVYNYLYSRNYDLLNTHLVSMSTTSRKNLLIGLGNYFRNSKNFECENLVQNRMNVPLHDPLVETELLDVSKNWRLKKELIMLLLNDIYSGKVRALENISLYDEQEGKESKFSIIRTFKENYKFLPPCRPMAFRYVNKKTFRTAERKTKKWLRKLNSSTTDFPLAPLSGAKLCFKERS